MTGMETMQRAGNFTDRFGIEFVSHWLRLRGACLIEVHLHDQSFWGNLKWPFKTGARLIQVAASAGGTVNGVSIILCSHSFYTIKNRFW